uniref:uncharacterized protein LOC122578408 n=1 Tax=Erigeron canadensis TaxID=72917 RepID=UPI001CB9371D|nr:uncharacterized protein LOC122578408 [Erigeron canadensis]
MAGLFTYLLGGAGIFLIGASESIFSSSETLKDISSLNSLQPPTPNSKSKSKSKSITSLIFFSISLISFLFILNSLISIISALKSNDQTGVVLQLQVISISILFFLFSILGLFTNLSNSIKIPSQLLNTLCLFAFIEEFIMFYLRKKDLDGIENRYYDLLLVPITVCIVCTLLELKGSSFKPGYSRLGRGVGLVLQGMWIVQMGFSFYSNLITDGCFIKEKSRGNFTIRCKGHPEFHRARAIATLQFNCHLALLVCFVVGMYGLVSKKYGVSSESLQYKPLGAEMQHLDQGRFTLDSDEDEDEVGDRNGGVKNEGNVAVETTVNGYGSHH